MPFNASTIAAIVVFLAAIAVYWRTKKIGATAAVIVGGFMVLAVADPAFLSEGANAVKKVFKWGFSQFTGS